MSFKINGMEFGKGSKFNGKNVTIDGKKIIIDGKVISGTDFEEEHKSKKQKKNEIINCNGKTINQDRITLNGNSNSITSSHSEITGNENIIRGDYLKIIGINNIINGDDIECNGDFNIITGDYIINDGMNCEFKGDHIEFKGGKCIATGDYITFTGNNCSVDGDHNTFKGDNNILNGDYITCKGDNNVINGDHCSASGFNNKVVGDYNTNTKTKNKYLWGQAIKKCKLGDKISDKYNEVLIDENNRVGTDKYYQILNETGPYQFETVYTPPKNNYSNSTKNEDFLNTMRQYGYYSNSTKNEDKKVIEIKDEVKIPKEEDEEKINEKDQNEDLICTLCYERNCNTVILDCGDMKMCVSCSRNLMLDDKKNIKKDVSCPFCKKSIKIGIIKVFKN